MRKARVDTFSLKTAFLLRNKSNQRRDKTMAVFRVEKNKGYTVMSNHHLRNKELSLKAKGLLSQMLSLPEDWDYQPCVRPAGHLDKPAAYRRMGKQSNADC